MDNDEETYQDRQKNEFLVLQSIFGKEIRDLRPDDSQKGKCPLEFIITLKPQCSASGTCDSNTRVDLHVKCPFRYPNVAPELLVKNPKGISLTSAEELKRILEEQAKTLCGEVMILELTQAVQTYLYKNIIPHYASFYEEMICNRKKHEEEEAKKLHEKNEIEKQKQEHRRKEIEEAMSRKKEELRLIEEKSKSDVKGYKSVDIKLEATVTKWSSFKMLETSPDAIQYPSNHASEAFIKQRQRGNSSSESILDHSSCNCEHKPKEIRFNNSKGERIIQRGKCLGHNTRGKVVYSGYDINTGELVVVSEWTFNLTRDKKKSSLNPDNYQNDNENLFKQLASIEQEFSSLNRLQHKNLVHYLGITRQHVKDKIIIAVLQEFVLGGNLGWHLSKNVPVELLQLRHYMSGILDALSFLHKNSVVHKDLRGSSIFLENDGLIRLADYSLEKRLTELYYNERNQIFEDSYPPSVGRGGKKTDIYRFGILCLSLAKGELVNTMFPEVPTLSSGILQDFIKKCLTIQDRWCVDELIQHSFINQNFMIETYPAKKVNNSEVEENLKTEVNGQENEVEFGDSGRHVRLKKEFKILEFLGSGGFGKVLKVRNKLDGGIYAIKSIALNPNSKLHRKMTREVKLLSKLNHENVVRYYNSWLETSVIDESDCASSMDESYCSDSVSQPTRIKCSDCKISPCKETVVGSVHQNPETSVSILFEYSSKQHDLDGSSSEEEEEEEDEDIFGTSFLPKLNDSGEICLKNNGQVMQSAYNIDLEKTNRTAVEDRHVGSRIVQFIYIQMEFCDKNTLREVIDKNELYADKTRVRRLFREIVEGLAHIHQQGMIHRDLKPGNIFMDSHDHVKIGDFGLATSTWSLGDSHHLHPYPVFENSEIDMSHSEGMQDGSLTGQVGTLMYISPEVKNITPLSYNQKVDIYSLGIIFFEMCYPALRTGMEKAVILGNLRKPEIEFPEDFREPDHISLIKWLLNHNPAERPTSQELLQSSYLPPPQMEEAELQDMLRHTISNPQSKAFKYMISSLFNQEISTAADVTYDMDLLKGTFSSKIASTYKFVLDSMIKVFEIHGALSVPCPLLMPKFKLSENQQYVNLIDHSGSVVCLPYDLQVPFCRFVVKNKVTSLKRYHISPVYRERKVYGCHPRSLYECAFDIVTPAPGSLIADAEVLHITMEIVNEFKTLQDRRCVIHLNHTSLLKGILVQTGIEEEKHDYFYNILKEARIERLSVYQRTMRLIHGLNLNEGSVTILNHLLSEAEGTIDKVSNFVKNFAKHKGKTASMIKQGVQQLETVIEHIKDLGMKASVVIAPDLVHNIHHMSGIMFQFSCELKKKRRKEGLDIVAIGGRYDQLVTAMRLEMGYHDLRQSVVGVSIAVEKLIYSLLESEDFHVSGSFDVFVCALGHNSCLRDKILVTRDLWNAGISSHLHNESLHTLEEIQEISQEYHASHMVILKESEVGNVRVRWWDKDKYMEKKIPSSELVEFLIQKGVSSKNDVQESSFSISTKVDSCRLERSSSETLGMNTNSKYTITFLGNEKLHSACKKRFEVQIKSRLNQVLQHFSTKINVEVIAIDFTNQIVNDIAAYLKIDGNEAAFQNSILVVTEKNTRHRKLLRKICETIWQLKCEKK